MLNLESSTDRGGKATPSNTTGARTLALDDGYAADPDVWNRPASSISLQCPGGTPSLPEPTVLLTEIQKAADDVEQVVGRFGHKMANRLTYPTVKAALFSDHDKLRLSSLGYADNFTYRRSRSVEQTDCFSKDGFPLLWWLWDPLLEFFTPFDCSKGFILEFASAKRTDVDLPYTIRLRLWSDQETRKIELTAAYGGDFNKRIILDAPIAVFKFPKKSFQKTTLPLPIDKWSYEPGYEAMFKYLMPRPDSIWCRAMSISEEHEETLVKNLAETRKSNNDRPSISDAQDLQCKYLVDRFPEEAREFVEANVLVREEFQITNGVLLKGRTIM
ncbi:hypothetical protein FoTM2_009182 [Fusarium oxysporum f. sp. vasinfectum]|nr:hypothetical protein FoTM2_009182 [Fusarium oxysporum f. sp. vasinfectum]